MVSSSVTVAGLASTAPSIIGTVGLDAIGSLILLALDKLEAVSATLPLRHRDSATLVDRLNESSVPLDRVSATLTVRAIIS